MLNAFLQGRVMCSNVLQVLKEFIFEKNKMHDSTQLGEDFNYSGFEDQIYGETKTLNNTEKK